MFTTLLSHYSSEQYYCYLLKPTCDDVHFPFTGLISEVELGAQSVVYELANLVYMVNNTVLPLQHVSHQFLVCELDILLCLT